MSGQFRSRGFYEDVDPERGVVLSGETFTCAHCGNLHELTFKVEGGRTMVERPEICSREWLPICPLCARKGGCVPFEKRMTAFERRMNEFFARNRMFEMLDIPSEERTNPVPFDHPGR